MSKLSEIRSKLQQAQQAKSNAVAQLDPKAKAKRLKRLKELLARLKKGEDITRRDLKGVLTDEQWQDFENANEYLKVDYTQVLERPQELNMYLDKLKQGDFYHARADSTPVTARSRIDSRNRNGRLRLRHQAEGAYEDAVMYLCDLLDGNDAQLAQEVRLWLDREVDTSVGNAPNADPQSVPRVKGSRSIHSESANGGANKFDLKRQYKQEAIENAIACLKS
jgi:hypothetical protein